MARKEQTEMLIDRAARLVEAAKAAGADDADAVAVRGRSKTVSVRNGKVENTDASEGDSMSLRVFVDGRVASVAADASTDPARLAERAVAMAKASPRDPYNTLAKREDLATVFVDLDKFDPTEVSAEQLTEDALATEAAAFAVKGVSKSSGASASAGQSGMVLVASNGFSGAYDGTGFGRSVAVIAGDGTAMERDYESSGRSFYNELRSAEEVGRGAGERAVRRLNPRRLGTKKVNVVFDPRVARGILGHLSSAINGSAVARKSTFLQNSMGKQIANEKITIHDDPLIVRGPASRPFDGEGVAGEKMVMVENGVLKNWFLSTSVGAELGLPTNGRGRRGGTSVGAGSSNLWMEPGELSPEELIRQIGTGLYVIEVAGQGVNIVSGEYSRGATGFWIENGEIAYPVSEVTIASTLPDMFKRMIPANDVDRTYSTAAPTLAVEGMTMAGE